MVNRPKLVPMKKIEITPIKRELTSSCYDSEILDCLYGTNAYEGVNSFLKEGGNHE